jgi:two-component system, chemotaxis family, chemotaxis protein CheY
MANVVIVDDSEYMINALSRFVQSNGHHVIATGNDGNEGFNLYRQYKPDLMILDLTMPNRHGRECLFDVLDCDPKARILIVSAVKNELTILECLDRGAKGFVEKPLKFADPVFCEDFLNTLNKAIAG